MGSGLGLGLGLGASLGWCAGISMLKNVRHCSLTAKCVMSVHILKTVSGLLEHCGDHERQSPALGSSMEDKYKDEIIFSCSVMEISEPRTTTPVPQSSSHGCLGSESYRPGGWPWLGLASSKCLGSVFPDWPLNFPISESLPCLRLTCPIL